MIFEHVSKVLLTEGGKTLSLNLEQKKAVVGEVSEQVANAQAIILAEYRGLQVGEMTELRAKARKSGVYLRVLRTHWYAVLLMAHLSLVWQTRWLVRWCSEFLPIQSLQPRY